MKIRYTGNDERRNLIPGKIYEAQDCEGMNDFGCLLRGEAGEEIRLDEEEFEEMDSYNAAHSEYRAVGLDVWGYDDWKQLDERIGRSWHCRFPSDKGDCYFRLLDEKIWYWWYVTERTGRCTTMGKYVSGVREAWGTPLWFCRTGRRGRFTESGRFDGEGENFRKNITDFQLS